MRKKLYLFVPIFLIALVIIVSITPLITMSENISNKVFRLHIIANSDGDFDQETKLVIRDEILELDDFSECDSLASAKKIAKGNISKYEGIANNVLLSRGLNYTATAIVTKEYFNTRYYDNFTLPAGYYDCLKIVLGSGKGHNWWCVMYPSVCITGCVDEFDKELTLEEKKYVTDKHYMIRFKTVEIYQKFKAQVKNIS